MEKNEKDNKNIEDGGKENSRDDTEINGDFNSKLHEQDEPPVFDPTEYAAKRIYEENLEKYRVGQELKRYETGAPPTPRYGQVKPQKGGRFWLTFIIAAAAIIIGGLITAFIIMPMIDASYGKTFVSETAEGDYALGGELAAITDEDEPAVEIAGQLKNAIVSVEARTATYKDGSVPNVISSATGSGIIISKTGYIATSEHLVDGLEEFKVKTGDGKVYDAKLAGTDKYLDAAILKIEGEGDFSAAPLGDSQNAQTGETAIVISNPSAMGQTLDYTVTVGVVSAAKRELVIDGNSINFIQTDAAMNLGSSGGALVNGKGEVIGMISMKTYISGYDEDEQPIVSEGIGFAAPINDIVESAKKIISTGVVVRPSIGLFGTTVSESDAKRWGVKGGLLVGELSSGGAAEAAGVKKGDIITMCDGNKISSIDIGEYVSGKIVGNTVTLNVFREGMEMEIPVKVVDVND